MYSFNSPRSEYISNSPSPKDFSLASKLTYSYVTFIKVNKINYREKIFFCFDLFLPNLHIHTSKAFIVIQNSQNFAIVFQQKHFTFQTRIFMKKKKKLYLVHHIKL